MAFPVREFGDIRLLMSIWRVPKVVLDACYPKYSVQNYEERRVSTTWQRGMSHYFAHAVDNVYPNFGLSLMDGVQRLFKDRWAKFYYEPEYDLYVTDDGMLMRHEVRDLLSDFFEARNSPHPER